MTSRKKLLAGLAFCALFGVASWPFVLSTVSPEIQTEPTPEPEPQVVITFSVAESIEGEIVAAIFEDEKSFKRRSKPVKRIKLSTSNSEPAQWVVEGIESGSYAVAAFVDLNGNSKLDKNMLGIPTEQYGFSNNVRGRFGPPKFEECVVHIADSSDLEIDLR